MLGGMSVWLWAAVAFLVGAGAGWGLSAYLRGRQPSEQRLRRLQGVLDRFQGEVAQHFQESGELITRLRTDVESLYHHLESGAARLTTEDAAQARLRQLEETAVTQPGHGVPDRSAER